MSQFQTLGDRIALRKLKPPSTYTTPDATGVIKLSWDTCFLQNEFPTDARRGSELAGDGDVDKEGDAGPFLVSPLEVTHRESRSP